MLHQVNKVRQESDTTSHLWYQSKDFDLFVWYEDFNEITMFQLCYDKPFAEKAVTWRVSSGWSHNRVDSGEEADRNPAKATPILLHDGAFEQERILMRFLEEAEQLPGWIAGFVAEKLQDYPDNSPQTRA